MLLYFNYNLYVCSLAIVMFCFNNSDIDVLHLFSSLPVAFLLITFIKFFPSYKLHYCYILHFTSLIISCLIKFNITLSHHILSYSILFNLPLSYLIFFYLFHRAFHVFKVFVANPKKPSEICSILYQNKTKLIPFLEAFQTDKGDEQFYDEKKLLIE